MQKKIIELIDDIDGTPEAETVTFAYEGKEYEIELSGPNRTYLESELVPFIQNARRVKGTVRRTRSKRA